MQDRVVQLARHRQWPEPGAAGVDSGEIGRQLGRAAHGNDRLTPWSVERDPDMRIGNRVALDLPFERGQCDAPTVCRPVRGRGQRQRAVAQFFVPG
jgi:hypothetical protein